MGYVSASSIIHFKLTEEERQEFAEVHAQLMTLTPEQSIMIDAFHLDKETGLVIGTDNEFSSSGLGVPFPAIPKIAFFKDAFVVGITPDGLTRYYVKDPSDILKLLKIVNAVVSEAFIGVTTDAVEEMMGRPHGQV